MSTLGTLRVRLTGDVNEYVSAMDSVLPISDKAINKMDDVGKSSSGLGGVFKNAFSFVIGGVIQAGIGGIVSSLGSLKSGMIDGNAEFERYQVQFGVLLKSTDAAKQRLDELAKFGASTPFELPEVVNADKILQGFGLHSEEAAKKFGFSGAQIRTIAGDVAAGTGISFQDAANYIGKFSSGATGEVISRFMELGITTREELTKLGLEFSKSGELLSPLPKATNVMLGLMKEKYGGMMDAQSKTFDGMMSNLNDWVAGTLRTIGQPIFEVLKDKLSGVLTFLGSPAVQTTITAFATGLAGGMQTAIEFVSKLSTSFSTADIGGTLGSIQIIFAGLVGWVIANMPLIQSTVLTVFSLISTYTTTYLVPMADFFSVQLAGVVAWFIENFPLMQQTAKTVFSGIKTVADAVMPYLSVLVGGTFTTIKLVVSTALEVLLGMFKSGMQLINGDFSGAWKTTLTTLTSAWENIKSYLGDFPAYFTKIGSAMITGLIDGISKMGDWFRGMFMSWLRNNLPGFAQQVLGISSPSKVAANEIGIPFAQGIATGLLSGGGFIRSSIDQTASNMMFSLPQSTMGGLAYAGGGGGVNVTINVDRMSDDVDVEMLAYRVAERIQRGS